MRLLLTGFDTFGSIADNPSARLVRALDGARCDAGVIVSAVLPVAISGLEKRLARLVDSVQPAAVLQFGVAETRTRLALERKALNEADFTLPDIDGITWRCRALAADGAPALCATLPLDAIAAAWSRAGLAWEWSDDAGRYLCNASFYQGLRLAAQRPVPLPWGFIHVPLPREENAAGAVSFAAMVEAARLAAEVTSLHLATESAAA
jgi:pyroglutamyl-peptidase